MKKKKIKKREEAEEIYINGKKMRKVGIGWREDCLLPYFPYEYKDGTKIYRLLEWIFYKKNGRYYMEVPE